MVRHIQPLARTYFAVLLGLQIMFAGFLVWGVVTPSSSAAAALTSHGADIYRPERELSIYVLAVIGTVLLSVLVSRGRGKCSGDGGRQSIVLGVLGAQERGSGSFGQQVRCATVWQCVVATFGAIDFIMVCLMAPRQVDGSGPLPLLFGVLPLTAFVAIWAFVAWSVRRRTPEWFLTLWADVEKQTQHTAAPESCRRFEAADLAIGGLLVLLVYIPNLAAFAGFDYEFERLHHWDFFVMGPALGYLHGGSLGNQVYAQYGLGFPLAVALMAKWAPVTYPNVMRMALLAGCAYYFVVY